MADVRISNLAAAVAANLDGNSLVPTTDSEGTITTVKVTLAQLRTSLLARAVGNFAATDYLSLGGASPPATGWIRVDGTTVTSSTPILSAIQTWNQGATVFTGLLVNVTNTSSSASSLLIDLQVGGFSKWKVDVSGNATTAGNLNTQAITCTTLVGTGAVSGFTTANFSGAVTSGGTFTATTGVITAGGANTDLSLSAVGAGGQVLLKTTFGTVLTAGNTGIVTAANGLTVSAGTTAVQALTATGMITQTIGDIGTGENSGLQLINTGSGGKTWNITAGTTGVTNSEFTFRNSTDDINVLRFGSTGSALFIAGITATAATFTAIPAESSSQNALCIVNATGVVQQNSTTTCLVSSRRFKEDIELLDPTLALEIVGRLEAVSFRDKGTNIPRFGLVAEDVDQAEREVMGRAYRGRLTGRNSDGVVTAIHTEGLIPLLLSTITSLRSSLKVQQEQLTTLREMVYAR